jgi:hypothetical protein
MRLRDRHTQVDDKILDGQAVDLVFEAAEPAKKLVALAGRNTRSLVREIRGDVAVGKQCFSGSER